MKEQLVEQVRDVAVEILQAQAREALTRASEAITNRERAQSDSPELYEKIDLVCERFGKFLRLNFDTLIKPSVSKLSLLGAASLSLADEADLEVANMLEGMVGYCRNLHMKEYLAFTTRFGGLFYDARIDETNNPLDPEQICRAFSDSLLPLKLLPRHQHPVYQRFNQLVLRHLDKTLEKASQVLVEKRVKPSLDVYVRSRDTVFGKRKGRRPSSNPLERAFDIDDGQYSMDSEASLSELFSTIQQCLGGEGTTSGSSNLSRLVAHNDQGMLLSVPARPLADKVSVENAIPREGLITLRVPSGKPVGGYHLRRLSRDQLLESLLTNAHGQASSREQTSPDNGEQTGLLDRICDCLLAQKQSSVLLGIDPQVRQDVEILALFFQAIDEDAALAEPLKALVKRTRVAALKLVLADKEFFSRDALPLADLVNEIGDTGFAWTDSARLQRDATYLKLVELVDRLYSAGRVDGDFVTSLLEELKTHRSGVPEMAAESAEQQNRVQLVRQVARRKLQERIPGELDPVVDEILNTHFLKFMEKLLLREGAGGNSWKYVIDTVEKLLWTLRKEKEPGDRNFFEKINPRIMANLEKVLQSAGVAQDEITRLLDKLLQLQLAAFEQAERTQRDQTAMETARQVFDDLGNAIEVPLRSDSDPHLAKAFIAENPDYLQQVDKLPVGTWVEFTVPGEANARCTLAGRMADGSELYFVSQHGVRMIEKSRIGLARELKDGTAKMVGEWPLFNRTLESVIATLRQRSSQ